MKNNSLSFVTLKNQTDFWCIEKLCFSNVLILPQGDQN